MTKWKTGNFGRVGCRRNCGTACRSAATWSWSPCSKRGSFRWPAPHSSRNIGPKLADVPLIQSNVSVVQWPDWFSKFTNLRAPERFPVLFDGAQMSLDAATQGLGWRWRAPPSAACTSRQAHHLSGSCMSLVGSGSLPPVLPFFILPNVGLPDGLCLGADRPLLAEAVWKHVRRKYAEPRQLLALFIQ
jgi:hypothetical protein